MTPLQQRASGDELPEAKTRKPFGAASLQLRPDGVARFADSFDLLGN
jgi:hypothetical protein